MDGGFIPVGFKAFVKIGDDEICLMTRDHNGVIEYQALYLPRSISAADLAVFRWDRDIQHVWNECAAAARHHHHDASMFSKSPWEVFGIANVTIQSRIAVEQSVIVSGILRCDAVTGSSTLADFKQYLKFAENDPDWIAQAMMEEPLPREFTRHVSDQSVYWVDGRTGISTWAHPLYAKYQQLLCAARKQKPLVDMKSVALFQLECLMNSKPIESMECLAEIARILRVDLRSEPFLCEQIKAALTHFSQGLSSTKLSDIQARISRKRREVNELRLAVANQQKQADSSYLCVECSSQVACMHCSDCADFFCRRCFSLTHASGARKYSHRTSIVELIPCVDCEKEPSVLECKQCLCAYCVKCFGTFHMRGGRRNHIPVAVRTGQPLSEFSASRSILEQAESPWVLVGGRYWNLVTGDSQRDRPLAPVNSVA